MGHEIMEVIVLSHFRFYCIFFKLSNLLDADVLGDLGQDT